MPLLWSHIYRRLSVQRLRTLQQKKEAQAKASRREIATLIERGKIETARIKVETLINEDVHVELLELLELYCELLLARFGLLDQNNREPDPGIAEGVCNVIHAAPRTELKELHILRDIFMHKYGRDFSLAVMENRNGCVSPRVVNKLIIGTPAPALVDGYLKEIAKAYGVPWADPAEQSNDNSEEPEKQKVTAPADQPPLKPSDKSNEEKDKVLQTSSAMPEPSRSSSDVKGSSPPPVEDEFELLSKRFAALKKR
ncbi:regulator of Vps4 activity in the MVB pathway-domain-containing protein [Gymnopilus junonius]|uniref:Regulator of Vps4 activity in the MVB pathway-domain-containing protein n=1 Tax=Gymnopilus junonius TaxID=109634 RepID=A0A9P5TS43_GYMJU|nr:regulator of Vps4 activity in the MVB pathway-domain-containing protein [Gymnopilus junonius]